MEKEASHWNQTATVLSLQTTNSGPNYELTASVTNRFNLPNQWLKQHAWVCKYPRRKSFCLILLCPTIWLSFHIPSCPDVISAGTPKSIFYVQASKPSPYGHSDFNNSISIIRDSRSESTIIGYWWNAHFTKSYYVFHMDQHLPRQQGIFHGYWPAFTVANRAEWTAATSREKVCNSLPMDLLSQQPY